jgi:hypothetical protein
MAFLYNEMDARETREFESHLRQCSNCRRTQRAHGDEWDWVTAHVTDPPPNISHGICPICIQQDYPEL